MTAGHRHHRLTDHHFALLHHFLTDRRVIADLDRPRHIDSDHDVPDLSGYSKDGATLYIDRHLAKARPTIDTMPYDHWITALVGPRGHEPVEKVAMDVWKYKYPAAHEMLATPSEHLVVKALGGRPDAYEKALRPWVKSAELERVEQPPIDLDCAPYYTDPDKNDLKVLAHLRKLGVADAGPSHEFHPVKIGAKQAPDGHYYINDHARPGKFMRVMNGGGQ